MAIAVTVPTSRIEVARVYRWVIVAVSSGAQASAAAMLLGLASIAPVLRAEYRLSLTGLGLMLGAPMFGLVLTLVVWGRVCDRLGERFVMTTGLAMGACLIAVVPLLSGPTPVMAVLAAAGAAVAGVNGAGAHAVMRWFPSRGRGLAMAVRQCALPLGAALGAVTLPVLAAASGPRAAFWALAGFAAVMAGTAMVLVRGPGRPASTRPDPAVKLRTWELFAHRPLLVVCAVAALLAFPQVALTGFMVELLGTHAHRSTTQAAQALACLHVAAMGLRLLVGWWSDQTGDRLRLVGMVALGTAVGFTALTLLLATRVDSLVIELTIVVVGALAVCWNGLAFLAAGELAPPGHTGTFLGIENTALFGSSAVGSVVVGALADSVGWSATIGALVAPPLAAAVILAYHGPPAARSAALTPVESSRQISQRSV